MRINRYPFTIQLCFFVQISSFNLDIKGNRRKFLVDGGAATSAAFGTAIGPPVLLTIPYEARASAVSEKEVRLDIENLLDAKAVTWTKSPERISWNNIRYRTSSLSAYSNNNAPPTSSPTLYPDWMEGYWSVTYRFKGASFPQGRKILSLRTPGAGMGTCISLPNVGTNPATTTAHFVKNNHSTDSMGVYEDWAYNIPRKFEAFWPESKVLSIQTNGRLLSVADDKGESNPSLSPKCFVTGDGCTEIENKNLHFPSSRFVMDFDGPTRRGSRLTQSSDLTLIGSSSEVAGDAYASVNTFSQFNVNQELQTFYKEFLSLKKKGDIIIGRIRVAAFLPTFIKDLDGGISAVYDENCAVALYDYKILFKSIDVSDAANI